MSGEGNEPVKLVPPSSGEAGGDPAHDGGSGTGGTEPGGRRRRRRRRRGPPKSLDLTRMIPNMLTTVALSAGLTAILFGLQGRWKAAVIAIVIAGIFDGLDGRVARLLGSASKFGAELDSLSDVVAFGVAPPMLIYLWTLKDLGDAGWVISVLFAVCCALRLARFNTMLEEPKAAWAQNFFSGVPAPGAAGLAILPMAASFQFGDEIARHPWVSAVMLLLVAGLMVSQVPTFSMKKVKVSRQYAIFVLLFVGLLATMLTKLPWLTLGIIGSVYLVSVAVGPIWYLRLRSLHAGDNDAGTDGDGPQGT